MFGYVTINKPELKVKEYETYKGFYCGACRALKKEYGFAGQLTLSYDMTFLTLLLSSLYEPDPEISMKRCIAHPAKKRMMIENKFSAYGAHMGILLAWYHFLDDWKDEKKLKALLGVRGYHRAFLKAKKLYPGQEQAIRQSIAELSRLEKERSMDIDRVSDTSGRMLGSIYAIYDDVWKERLYKTGYYLGKFIYLMDAYDDLEDDEKEGNYNLLLLRKRAYYKDTPEEEKRFKEDCRMLLVSMMAQCTKQFEQLPLLKDVAILENILYDGVWNCFLKHENESEEDRLQSSERRIK